MENLSNSRLKRNWEKSETENVFFEMENHCLYNGYETKWTEWKLTFMFWTRLSARFTTLVQCSGNVDRKVITFWSFSWLLRTYTNNIVCTLWRLTNLLSHINFCSHALSAVSIGSKAFFKATQLVSCRVICRSQCQCTPNMKIMSGKWKCVPTFLQTHRKPKQVLHKMILY